VPVYSTDGSPTELHRGRFDGHVSFQAPDDHQILLAHRPGSGAGRVSPSAPAHSSTDAGADDEPTFASPARIMSTAPTPTRAQAGGAGGAGSPARGAGALAACPRVGGLQGQTRSFRIVETDPTAVARGNAAGLARDFAALLDDPVCPRPVPRAWFRSWSWGGRAASACSRGSGRYG